MGFFKPVSVVKIPVTIGTFPIQNVELNSGATFASAPPQKLVFGDSDDSGKNRRVYLVDSNISKQV